MESASIWDIYANARKLLPLYDRMQNRTVRQESLNIQYDKTIDNSNKSNKINCFNEDDLPSSIIDPSNTFLNPSIRNEHKNSIDSLNYLNTEDVVSVDLMTPLSSSPGGISFNHANINHSTNNRNNNINNNSGLYLNGNNVNFLKAKNNNNSNPNGKPDTPNSLTGSPNVINNSNNNNIIDEKNITKESNNKPVEAFHNFAFSDIIDLNNDDFIDINDNNNNYDILQDLMKLDSMATPPNLMTNNSNNNNNNNNTINHQQNTFDLNNNLNNNNNNNNYQTIRPVDIKVKSESSISINNENILSNNGIGTLSKDSSKSIPKSNINKQKMNKLNSDVPSPSNRLLGSTPQPNELQTQARSKNISSSVPNKEQSKTTSKCNNCGTSKTPLWRKDPNGNTLCNACGLFLKLHGTMRPLSLKTDIIKKRNSKRQSVSNQGEGYKNLSHLSQSQNSKFQGQLPNTSTIYFPQSLPISNNIQPNNNNNNNNSSNSFNSNTQNQFNQQLQIHFQQQGIQLARAKNSRSSASLQSQFQAQSPISNSLAKQNLRSKNVPILPKPSKDSSPSTPTSTSNFSASISPSQPQDIPQFKRRKSKLNIASLQTSQPSSPLTIVNTNMSYSPLSSSASSVYSPRNSISISNIESPGYNASCSPAGSISMNPPSISRHNSISSNQSSHNLYQDINNKRGLSFSANNTNQQPRQSSKPSNFSNLSAGINAIRSSSSSSKSGLSKCVANVNDNYNYHNESKNVKLNMNSNSNHDNENNNNIDEVSNVNNTNPNNLNNNTKNSEIDMGDLDWLKFDI